MRLIDADELIKDRVSNDPVVIAAKCAPTAYDVDKVVEYLKGEAARWEESGTEYKDKRELGVAEGYRRAAKDVKSGGAKLNRDRCKCSSCQGKTECCAECDGTVRECEKYSEIRPDE